MGQTIRDALMECELYPYSAEYFDILKEGYELDLMNQYIEDVQFIREYKDEFDAKGYQFNESYFQESLSDEDFDKFLEEAEQKKEGFIQKIKNGAKALVAKLKKIWNAIFKKTAATNQEAEKLIDRLAAIELNADDVDKIMSIVKENNQTGNVVKSSRQPYAETVRSKIKYASPNPFAGRTSEQIYFENELAKVLSDTEIFIAPFEIGTPCVEAETLINLVSTNGLYNVKLSDVNSEIDKVKKDGLKVVADNKKLQGYIDKLGEIERDYADAKFGVEQNDKNRKRGKGEYDTDINYSQWAQILGLLQQVTNSTMSVYSRCLTHREKSIAALNKWLDTRGKATEDEKAPKAGPAGIPQFA